MKLNQTLFLATLTLAAFASSVSAQTQTASNAAPVVGPAAATPAATLAAVPAPPITLADIQELKDALAAQAQQIAALQAQLAGKSAATPAQVAAAIQPATTPAIAPPHLRHPPRRILSRPIFQEPHHPTRSTQNAGSSDERIRQPGERQIQGLRSDLLQRRRSPAPAEPFFGGTRPIEDFDRCPRSRARTRTSISTADLGDQFRAGLTLSQAGTINDPTSTNQSSGLASTPARRSLSTRPLSSSSPQHSKLLPSSAANFVIPGTTPSSRGIKT